MATTAFTTVLVTATSAAPGTSQSDTDSTTAITGSLSISSPSDAASPTTDPTSPASSFESSESSSTVSASSTASSDSTSNTFPVISSTQDDSTSSSATAPSPTSATATITTITSQLSPSTPTNSLPTLPHSTIQVPPMPPQSLKQPPYPHNFVFMLFGGIIGFFAVFILGWRCAMNRYKTKHMRMMEEEHNEERKRDANADNSRSTSSRDSGKQEYSPIPLQSTYGGLGPPPTYDSAVDLGECHKICEEEDGFELQVLTVPPSTGSSERTVSTGSSSDRRSIRSATNWSVASDLGARSNAPGDRVSILSGYSAGGSSARTLVGNTGSRLSAYAHHRRTSSYLDRQFLAPPNDAFRKSSWNSTLYVSPALRQVVRGSERSRPLSEEVRRGSSGFAYTSIRASGRKDELT